MKYLMLALWLFGFGCSQTKQIKTSNMEGDELRKYSYLIIGYKGEQIFPVGTGFFYKFDEGYKFITTKHSVSEINTFNKQSVPNHYDFIGIVYTDTVKNTSAFIRLDIRSVKSMLPNTFFYESPDIVVFDLIGLKLNIKIYPINDLLPKSNKIYTEVEKIIIWGYAFPAIPQGSDLDSVRPSKYEGTFAGATHIDPYYPPAPELYSVIQPEIIQGMSGAPVFFEYSNGKGKVKTKTYKFAGLVFGTNAPYKAGYMHTYDATMAEIKKRTLLQYTF